MDFDKVRSRSSMFFPLMNEKVDAVSFFIHFLSSVTFELSLTRNFKIDFSNRHNWYFLTLFSEHFKVSPKVISHLKESFDFSYYTTDKHKELVEIMPSIELLRSIVWFSEYCIISTTDDHELGSQAFLNAHAIGELIQRPNQEGINSQLSFQFNLSDGNLNLRKPSIEELHQAIGAWKERLPTKLQDSNKNTPYVEENIVDISGDFYCSVKFVCE